MSNSSETRDGPKCELFLVLDVQSPISSLKGTLERAYSDGFGLLCYPLVDPLKDNFAELIKCNANENEQKTGDVHEIPFNYVEHAHSNIYSSVYGKISPWIKLSTDAQNIAINASCEQLMQQEMEYASHLGIYYLIAPSPVLSPQCDVRETAAMFASAMIAAFSPRAQMVGIVPIPLTDVGWQLWSTLAVLLRDTKNVRPALIVESEVPSPQLLDQWFAEGVQIFLVDESLFQTNKKGFPVLSRLHQKLLQRFFARIDCTVVVTGEPETPKLYAQYVRHVWSQCDALTRMQAEEKPFWDVLQTPLQPLSHNLQYSTYETFEADPVKYTGYEKAIIQALTDLEKQSATQKHDQNDGASGGLHAPFTVMVLGAGRGPLVTAALKASKTTGVDIALFALEKNPFAIPILRYKNKHEWNGRVQIVQQDMRTWQCPQKAHIIVSELLGSFGDNELSPECLDGAQRVLRENGICIPCKYQSFLCPVSNNAVYSKLKTSPTEFETPYVVHLMRHCLLSEIQQCWSFHHPLRSEDIMENNAHNARYAKLSFTVQCAQQTVVHGFSGYFDAVLYKNEKLSIHPETFSKDMFSWFPMYFPLMQPIQVQNGDTITVHIWRKTDKTCVWYEWCLSQPVVTAIHNPNHRSYAVNLH